MSNAGVGGVREGLASGETLVVHDAAALTNLGVLARKAEAMDASALLRIRAVPPGPADDPVAASRTGGVARVWATTPFGPVACRTMAISPGRDDMVVRADAVSAATGDARSVPQLGAAIPMTLQCGAQADSSWPGHLPVDVGWTVVDAVPAAVFRDMETRARAVAKVESGPLGLPTSLLDQKVLTVRFSGTEPTGGAPAGTTSSGADPAGTEPTGAAPAGTEHPDGTSAEISMREVFALCAMGFIPGEPAPGEPVRVSVKGRWRRLDGRYGSVFASEGFGVLPI